MKVQLEPMNMLLGCWKGKGKGSYGPFDAEMEVTERGRWLLMRQEIKVPILGFTTYVSTQVYGYDEHSGLTLDFFDTAGAFHFIGNRDPDGLEFVWTQGEQRKVSRYRIAEAGLLFDYRSHMFEDGEPEDVHFEGLWERAE